MSDGIKRDGSGQFVTGQSGNPDGARRRAPKELLSITDFHRIQLEVAGEMIVTTDGKRMTRYEGWCRGLGKANSDNRLARKDSIELTQRAGSHFASVERRRALNKGSQ